MRCFISILLIISMVLCMSSCMSFHSPAVSDTQSSENTTAKTDATTEQNHYIDLPTTHFHDFAEYREYVESTDLPDFFIKYDQLSMLGDFDFFEYPHAYAFNYEQYRYWFNNFWYQQNVKEKYEDIMLNIYHDPTFYTWKPEKSPTIYQENDDLRLSSDRQTGVYYLNETIF